MKKLQSVLCTALLSTVLVGNVLAGSTVGPVYSFMDTIIYAVASLMSGGDCPPRQCQNCRPTEKDENGDCRPKGE